MARKKKIIQDRPEMVATDNTEYIVAPPDPEREKRKKFVNELYEKYYVNHRNNGRDDGDE